MFQAVTGIKNKYENTIFLLRAANCAPNSFSNVGENVIACQSTDVGFFCWDSAQCIWKCHV